jgi:hypothetical protein
MTVGPISGQTPMSVGPAHLHTRLARWAVGLAETAAVVLALGYGVLGVAYVIGGASAIEDTWVGFLTVGASYAGLVASFAGFALAVVAKAKHEAWSLLWLPLTLFPGLAVLLVLLEAFWME